MRHSVSCFVAFALMAACSGNSVSGTGPDANQTCTNSAHARCTRIQTCSSYRLAELYGDEASCEDRVKANCLNLVSAPGTGNSTTHVAGCAAAIASWNCTDFLVDANPPPECAPVTGSVPNGGACYVAPQCQSSYCAIGANACGTCASPPTAGQPCTPTRGCATGLFCTSDLTCATPAGGGAACGKSQSCAPGFRCVGGTCTAYDSAATAGQPCGQVNGKLIGCAAGSCTIPTGNSAGTCTNRGADGATCDLAAGPVCETPALCVSGTCQIPACH
jgi:hypothetical protein